MNRPDRPRAEAIFQAAQNRGKLSMDDMVSPEKDP
jgi:hypothetical protein